MTLNEVLGTIREGRWSERRPWYVDTRQIDGVKSAVSKFPAPVLEFPIVSGHPWEYESKMLQVKIYFLLYVHFNKYFI